MRTLSIQYTVALFFNLDIAPLLLSRGADTDAQDRYGHSPLHRAASKGYDKMVQIMLQVKYNS